MWRPIAACVAVGLLAGLVVAALESPGYEARASVIVAPALTRTDPALGTLTRTAVSLVRSRSVAQNASDALRLGSPDDVLRRIGAHARAGTAVVDVTATGRTAVDAARLAQEVVVAFQALAEARLGRRGTGPAVSVWDAPGAGATRRGKPFVPWGVGGASLGLLAAAGLVLGRRRPRRSREPAAGPVAAPVPVPDPAPQREREPEREPELEPEPEPDTAPGPAAQPAPEPRGLIAELARRTADEPDPGRRAEMEAYLPQFQGFADGDGNLPSNLLALVEDVYGPV